MTGVVELRSERRETKKVKNFYRTTTAIPPQRGERAESRIRVRSVVLPPQTEQSNQKSKGTEQKVCGDGATL